MARISLVACLTILLTILHWQDAVGQETNTPLAERVARLEQQLTTLATRIDARTTTGPGSLAGSERGQRGGVDQMVGVGRGGRCHHDRIALAEHLMELGGREEANASLIGEGSAWGFDDIPKLPDRTDGKAGLVKSHVCFDRRGRATKSKKGENKRRKKEIMGIPTSERRTR